MRYAYWVGGVLSGDLGESLRSRAGRRPGREKLPVTLQLAGMAMLIALLIGIPAGIMSAVKKAQPGTTPPTCLALWGCQHAQFLAGHPDDPAVLGDAGLAAGVGLRQPVRGPGAPTSRR
jgi:peptide/nickel transport system permease protein